MTNFSLTYILTSSVVSQTFRNMNHLGYMKGFTEGGREAEREIRGRLAHYSFIRGLTHKTILYVLKRKGNTDLSLEKSIVGF